MMMPWNLLGTDDGAPHRDDMFMFMFKSLYMTRKEKHSERTATILMAMTLKWSS